MYFQDKIIKCNEVTEAKNVSNIKPFYVFLAPKTENAESVLILSGKPYGNKEQTNIPLAVGCWNPITFKSLNVTSEAVANYSVFIGEE